MNMLTAEYNYEKDMAVQRQEAIQLGVQQGIQQGIQQGVQQGVQQGATQKEMEIAQKMVDRGYTVAEIARLTDLTAKEIASLHHTL